MGAALNTFFPPRSFLLVSWTMTESISITNTNPTSGRTGISHEEERRRNIVPQECRHRPHGHRTETCENDIAIEIGKNSEREKSNHEKTTCQSIETIRHVHRIRRTNKDEHEDRHVPPPHTDIAVEGHMNLIIAEFHTEPPRTNEADEQEKQDLRQNIQPLPLPETADVPVIIHRTEQSHGEEREERKVHFAALEEGVIHKPQESECAGEEYREKNGRPDEYAAHRRRAELILVVLTENRRIPPINRLNPELFPKAITPQEGDKPWRCS